MTYYYTNAFELQVLMHVATSPILLDWEDISSDPRISFAFIDYYKNFPWDYTAVSARSDLSHNDIIAHSTIPFDYTELSTHVNIETVCALPDKDWDYEFLATQCHTQKAPVFKHNQAESSDDHNSEQL